jgi:cytochrome b561
MSLGIIVVVLVVLRDTWKSVKRETQNSKNKRQLARGKLLGVDDTTLQQEEQPEP